MIPTATDGVSEDAHLNSSKTNFICGVVEGFYGRPWTTEQRRKLFSRMGSLGMNTYIYAPKDDSKHRMHWRELYTVDEAEPLTTLIQSACESGVTFVYALSPGLDITYSSAKDVTNLKHKLEQVASFGCKAFALLFDDIDIELCDADKSLFQSFGAAQVSVTNEVFQHLRQPSLFFFCPTEYCASRAVPSVVQSKYLETVGSKLLPDIEVMWTGPKVISRRISVSSIEELSRVLRRPPLIWDNIHANDYDPKRLFLGPYDGRSPKLVPHIRGVLTNPNCEFESNFMALHTLAQWSKTSEDSSSQGKKDFILSGCPGSADIRLETEGSNDDSCSDEDADCALESGLSSSDRYAPRQAARRAVAVWHAEFSSATLHAGTLLQKPLVGPTCAAVVPQSLPVCNGGNPDVNQMAILEVADEYIQPISSVTITSSLHKTSECDASSSTTSGIDVEPMDYVVTPGSTPVSINSVTSSVADPNTASYVSRSAGDIESDEPVVNENTVGSDILPPASSETMQIDNDFSDGVISIDDVTTIVDMFYLPFEYGPRATKLLSDFFWIKLHAAESISSPVHNSNDQLFGIDCDEFQQSADNNPEFGIQSGNWRERASSFQLRIRKICETIDRVIEIPNRALAYELFPYLWDIKGILFQLDNFVNWLAECAKLTPVSRYYLCGSPYSYLKDVEFDLDIAGMYPVCNNNALCLVYVGANKFYRDQVTSRDQEPWLFRGGLLGEIQRMLPFENAPDLLFHPCPPHPQTIMFQVRPYKPVDKDAVYKICLETCNDGTDGQNLYLESPDIMPDKLIGPFLSYSAENCFVIVDQQEKVCGYVLTALDAVSFFDNIANRWTPLMTQKHPLHNKTIDLTRVEEIISAFHSPFKPVVSPAEWYQSYVHISIHAVGKDTTTGDASAIKRAFTCAVTALKIMGSRGVYTSVDAKHRNTLQLYRNLGFLDLPVNNTHSPDDVLTLGRVI